MVEAGTLGWETAVDALSTQTGLFDLPCAEQPEPPDGFQDVAVPLGESVAQSGPVSYTHLDVYKRQRPSRIGIRTRLEPEVEESIVATWIRYIELRFVDQSKQAASMVLKSRPNRTLPLQGMRFLLRLVVR